ncbi:MAG TPA: YnbE family lipoprotein [Sphingomicrobium sp.]|nr:YnbE family lipoprotein [Sphingomicrobium sp.]
MTRTRILHAALGTALALPLAGCISVSPPDKPIEINLNVTIRQEVLVRLQRDVEQLIQQNPQAFPQQPQPQPPRQR